MAESLMAISGNPIVTSVLFGVKTAMDLSAGQQQAGIYKAQSQQYELAAKQEELKGREQADRIRRSLQANLASQNAIFAARGISTTSGTPVSLASRSKTEAGADIETAMFNAGQSSYALRSQAQQAKLQGKAAITSSYMKAGETLYAGRDAFGSLLR